MYGPTFRAVSRYGANSAARPAATSTGPKPTLCRCRPVDRPCGTHCNNDRCDPVRCFGYLPAPPADMTRGAVMAFPDPDGEPQARLILERVKWQQSDARAYLRGDRPRTAAWLMCNPSKASHLVDDPTAGRVVHHSGRAGCPRSLAGNIWPLRTPYPADLWAAMARGFDMPAETLLAMRSANLDALCMIGAQADIHIVAFGAEPPRRFPAAVMEALDAFTCGGRHDLYCLGVAGGGEPLHPLARGKYAVRNDTPLRLWKGPATLDMPRGVTARVERTWDEVFSDKRRTAGGWADR